MTGLITQSAVLLLARKRLERIQRLLQAKVRSAGIVNSTERQLLFLANQALLALQAPPLPNTGGEFVEGSFTPWLAGGISMFATAGAVGLDFPQEAARGALGQQWLATTLRGGSADPQRQRVRNGSGRLLMKLADRVRTAVLADTSKTEAQRNTALAEMLAFAIGHAAQLATLLAAPPYLDEVDAQPGRSTPPARLKPLPLALRGALEASVNVNIFKSANPARPFWQTWLPAPDKLPDHLFAAYAAAAEDVYGPGARVPGSKAFNDLLHDQDPPPLSARLLRDGYETFHALNQGRYGWTYGDWLGATFFMFLPAMLMLPFAALLPHAKDLQRNPAPAGADAERGAFELVMFPLAFSALAPLGITLKIMLGSYLGAGKETIFALVNAIVGVVVAIVFFATLGADLPGLLRWPLLFILPLIADVVLMFFVLTRGGSDQRHRQLAFGTVVRIALAVLFVVCFLAFLHFAVEGLADHGFASGAFWGLLLLWLAMVFGAWLGFTALLVRSERGGPAPAPDPEVSDIKQWLRLYDDSTLGSVGAVGVAGAAEPVFPGDLAPVLKLWWTGPGDLFIRPLRNALAFSFRADGSTPQTVATPLAPLTVGEFGAWLSKAVAEPGPLFTSKLRVERFAPTDPLDDLLPSGDAFANHGDAETTVEARLAAAAQFRKLPRDGEGYLLSLAPRVRQAVAFGRGGEVLLGDDAAAVTNPPGRLLAIPGAGSVQVVGNAATRFVETFQPGDVLQIAGPPLQTRVVVAVANDQNLTVNLALSLAAAGAPHAYVRAARDRLADLAGPGTVLADGSVFRQVVGNGAAFEQMFMPGDMIEIQPLAPLVPGSPPPAPLPPERRTVLAVLRLGPPSLLGVVLQIDAPFSNALTVSPAVPPLPVGATYRRIGGISQRGLDFAPLHPSALFDGESLLDRAADLATLLSLGVTSRLLPDALAAAVPGNADDAHPAVSPALQVFRDWNLNHRRVNEWRMLVEGGAFNEPDSPATASLLGWVPLLNRWLDMAHRPGQDSHGTARFRPQDPPNVDLSRALASLLSLPLPA